MHARLRNEENMEPPEPLHSGAFLATRETLLSRLRQVDDGESWKEFLDMYGGIIFALARKSDLTETESQDVVQETCISVARKMPGFHYDPAIGSFKSWLFQITRRRIADQFRKRIPQVLQDRAEDDARGTPVIERIPDPGGFDLEKSWDRDWHRNILNAALTRLKRKVSPGQYQMYDLYVIQQLPMKKVTEILGVNRAQVYMAKMRVGRVLCQEIERIKKSSG
jgi:RNA polymerase sigma-70 factor (ECF subfamily)